MLHFSNKKVVRQEIGSVPVDWPFMGLAVRGDECNLIKQPAVSGIFGGNILYIRAVALY